MQQHQKKAVLVRTELPITKPNLAPSLFAMITHTLHPILEGKKKERKQKTKETKEADIKSMGATWNQLERKAQDRDA
jgi:hypothetical protein